MPIDLLELPEPNAMSECTERTGPRSCGGEQPAADFQYLCGAESGSGSDKGETGVTRGSGCLKYSGGPSSAGTAVALASGAADVRFLRRNSQVNAAPIALKKATTPMTIPAITLGGSFFDFLVLLLLDE